MMLGTPYKVTDLPTRIIQNKKENFNGLSRYAIQKYDRKRSTRPECIKIKLISYKLQYNNLEGYHSDSITNCTKPPPTDKS